MKDLTSPESDFGKALIVDNVHPDDAGIYECRSQHLFHQMHVYVTGLFYSHVNSQNAIQDIFSPILLALTFGITSTHSS